MKVADQPISRVAKVISRQREDLLLDRRQRPALQLVPVGVRAAEGRDVPILEVVEQLVDEAQFNGLVHLGHGRLIGRLRRREVANGTHDLSRRHPGRPMGSDSSPKDCHLPNIPPAWSHVPTGWVALLEATMEQLDIVAPGWLVVQVKQKFGGLRLYVELPEDLETSSRALAHSLVSDAERESCSACDVCGEPGTLTQVRKNYWQTRCESHVLSDDVDASLRYTRRDRQRRGGTQEF